MRRIVLLGIGHTNAEVVRRWADDPIHDCELVCVSNFPTVTYSGMLPGTLGDQFGEVEMRIDLERLARRAGAELVIAETIGLDRDVGALTFADHPSIRFDALSVGVGSMPVGWQEHRAVPHVVPIKPMQTFLRRLEACLRSASKPPDGILRVAIVGGGVASVEVALCLQQHWKHWLKRESPQPSLAISILTRSPRVAKGMTDRSVRRIEKLLADRAIRVIPEVAITGTDGRSVITEGRETHAADCVIWATGAGAPPVLQNLGLETDERGFLATDPTMQSLTDPRVFAVGDAGTIVRAPAAKAGVHAVRQAPVLWDNLHALIEDRPLRPYQPQSVFLKILNTGDGKGLLERGRWTFYGRWCWHLKTWIDRRFVGQFPRPSRSGPASSGGREERPGDLR